MNGLTFNPNDSPSDPTPHAPVVVAPVTIMIAPHMIVIVRLFVSVSKIIISSSHVVVVVILHKTTIIHHHRGAHRHGGTHPSTIATTPHASSIHGPHSVNKSVHQQEAGDLITKTISRIYLKTSKKIEKLYFYGALENHHP